MVLAAHVELMLSTLKKRISVSETYRLFRVEGLNKAGLHIWLLLRHQWRALLFTKVDGYIAEADLRDFRYSEKYRKTIIGQRMEFHMLKHGESLPDFCYGITQQEIESRLAAYHRCYILKSEDKVVCTSWIGLGRINYEGNSIYLYSDHTTFTLKPDQAWLYDSMCDPQQRRRGLSTGLMNEVLQNLKNSGIIFVLATIGLDNIGNIKALLRNGFRLKEKVLFRRYLFFKKRGKQFLSDSENNDIRIYYKI
ncbi:MAG: GNAT family N-acetyltransferase [Deltaproteobacteria bacterium]|nr:GNAT family N-acetyltransferase [Deltaproteobacteria bacterium]